MINKYQGALWRACKIMNAQDNSKSVKELYEMVIENMTDDDLTEVRKYINRKYYLKTKDYAKEYQKQYREAQKLKVLRGE